MRWIGNIFAGAEESPENTGPTALDLYLWGLGEKLNKLNWEGEN